MRHSVRRKRGVQAFEETRDVQARGRRLGKPQAFMNPALEVSSRDSPSGTRSRGDLEG